MQGEGGGTSTSEGRKGLTAGVAHELNERRSRGERRHHVEDSRNSPARPANPSRSGWRAPRRRG
eukprot:2198951-Pleurochrysis_carterae.AAC.1